MPLKGKVDGGVDGVFQDRDGGRDLCRGVPRHGLEMGLAAVKRRATQSLQ